jgi:hypothetical protein
MLELFGPAFSWCPIPLEGYEVSKHSLLCIANNMHDLLTNSDVLVLQGYKYQLHRPE